LCPCQNRIYRGSYILPHVPIDLEVNIRTSSQMRMRDFNHTWCLTCEHRPPLKLSAVVPKKAGGADAGPIRELRSAVEHDSH
jgi:hypothetical protein